MVFSINIFDLSGPMYCKSFASISCASSSPHDPLAITRNLHSSFLEFLNNPSDIFDTIEIAHLLICEVRLYFSSFGKALVTLYISSVNE